MFHARILIQETGKGCFDPVCRGSFYCFPHSSISPRYRIPCRRSPRRITNWSAVIEGKVSSISRTSILSWSGGFAAASLWNDPFEMIPNSIAGISPCTQSFSSFAVTFWSNFNVMTAEPPFFHAITHGSTFPSRSVASLSRGGFCYVFIGEVGLPVEGHERDRGGCFRAFPQPVGWIPLLIIGNIKHVSHSDLLQYKQRISSCKQKQCFELKNAKTVFSYMLSSNIKMGNRK